LASRALPTSTRICLPSLHDALPILARLVLRERLRLDRAAVEGEGTARCEHATRTLAGVVEVAAELGRGRRPCAAEARHAGQQRSDRKSTRLNSSHQIISYAVFCVKK